MFFRLNLTVKFCQFVYKKENSAKKSKNSILIPCIIKIDLTLAESVDQRSGYIFFNVLSKSIVSTTPNKMSFALAKRGLMHLRDVGHRESSHLIKDR